MTLAVNIGLLKWLRYCHGLNRHINPMQLDGMNYHVNFTPPSPRK
jgi:hypothetical protein